MEKATNFHFKILDDREIKFIFWLDVWLFGG